MPDPCQYDSRNDFMAECMRERNREYPRESRRQSSAVCNSMWEDRDCSKNSVDKDEE